MASLEWMGRSEAQIGDAPPSPSRSRYLCSSNYREVIETLKALGVVRSGIHLQGAVVWLTSDRGALVFLAIVALMVAR